MEEKLEKKEKDFNRINMTYARLLNKNKKPENNIDKLLDEIDKLKKENKKLRAERNFIGLSFIADDLEGSQFIDDKCFGDILNGLDKNTNNNIEYKSNNNVNKNKEENKNGNNKINRDEEIDGDKGNENNDKDMEKEKISRPIYSRRYYKNIRGRDNQGNKKGNI